MFNISGKMLLLLHNTHVNHGFGISSVWQPGIGFFNITKRILIERGSKDLYINEEFAAALNSSQKVCFASSSRRSKLTEIFFYRTCEFLENVQIGHSDTE